MSDHDQNDFVNLNVINSNLLEHFKILLAANLRYDQLPLKHALLLLADTFTKPIKSRPKDKKVR